MAGEGGGVEGGCEVEDRRRLRDGLAACVVLLCNVLAVDAVVALRRGVVEVVVVVVVVGVEVVAAR